MKRSSELRNLCVALPEAHSRADAPFIESHVSTQEGVLSIGSDPKEWIEGERVLEAFKQALQDDDVRSSPSENDFVRELDAFVEGTVGPLVASDGRLRMEAKSPCAGARSSIWKMASGRWSRRTPPWEYLTNRSSDGDSSQI
jgi:hypothetical protein